MTDLCNTCMYRTRSSGVSMCEYLNLTHEPRGCEPSECEVMGKYKEGKKEFPRNPNDVTILWEFRTSVGRKR